MSIRKRSNVIPAVIAAFEKGLLIPSFHATEQMQIRDVQFSDIEEMIYRSQREEHKDALRKDGKDWKYAIRGSNANGEKDIRLIVIFNDPEAVIITVIDKNRSER